MTLLPPPPPSIPLVPSTSAVVIGAPIGPTSGTLSPGVTPVDFELVRRLVRERSGIVLEPRQDYLLTTRLRALATRRSLSPLAKLFDLLRLGSDARLSDEIVEALTTNETSFFRDAEPFEALKGHVLPQLLRARASRRALRVWSAASSSGQEAYSMLMLLRDSFPQLGAWRTEVLGTDLNATMIRRAREATYSGLEVQRGMTAATIARWLEPVGDEFRVKEELRKLAEFREMNLIGAWLPLATFDLVLLRNVLIYFDLETKQKVLQRLRAVLSPDGFLMIGASESLLGVDESWKTIRIGRMTVYQP